jgi:hypothetical protein
MLNNNEIFARFSSVDREALAHFVLKNGDVVAKILQDATKMSLPTLIVGQIKNGAKVVKLIDFDEDYKSPPPLLYTLIV